MEDTTTPNNEDMKLAAEPVLDDVEEVEEERSGSNLRSSLLWALMVVIAFALGAAAAYAILVRPLQARLDAAEARAAAAEEQVAQAQNNPAQGDPAGQTAQTGQQQNVTRYDVPLDDDFILGPDTAEITIVEFSDFECPFCRRWHSEVLPQIREKYGDKVRFVYRDFPLYEIHPNAEPAAIAANCAGQQEKYWEYNELLFNGGKELGADTYEAYAKDLGLKVDAFQACLSDPKLKEEVSSDYQYAVDLGVRSTPTFFINGLAIVGAQPFDVFQRVIDMELAGEIP